MECEQRRHRRRRRVCIIRDGARRRRRRRPLHHGGFVVGLVVVAILGATSFSRRLGVRDGDYKDSAPVFPTTSTSAYFVVSAYAPSDETSYDAGKVMASIQDADGFGFSDFVERNPDFVGWSDSDSSSSSDDEDDDSDNDEKEQEEDDGGGDNDDDDCGNEYDNKNDDDHSEEEDEGGEETEYYDAEEVEDDDDKGDEEEEGGAPADTGPKKKKEKESTATKSIVRRALEYERAALSASKRKRQRRVQSSSMIANDDDEDGDSDDDENESDTDFYEEGEAEEEEEGEEEGHALNAVGGTVKRKSLALARSVLRHALTDDKSSSSSSSPSKSFKKKTKASKHHKHKHTTSKKTKKHHRHRLLNTKKLKLTPQNLLRLLQNHRSEITLALTLFAFRREIYHFLYRYVLPTTVDERTGQRHVTISVTSIIKIALFVDVMRKFLHASSGSAEKESGAAGGGGSSGSAAGLAGLSPLLTLLFGVKGTLLGGFLASLLSSGGMGGGPGYNPAYLPPIEQHYTFERYNERYTMDGLALRKALPLDPMMGVMATAKRTPATASAAEAAKAGFEMGRRIGRFGIRSPSSSSPTSSSSSTPTKSSSSQTSRTSTSSAPSEAGGAAAAAAATPTATTNNIFNSTTVIVLDLTGLDVKVTKMAELRDQISFLIERVRRDRDLTSAAVKEVFGGLDKYGMVMELGSGSGTDGKNNTGGNNTVSDEEATTKEYIERCRTFVQTQRQRYLHDVEIVLLLESPGGSVADYGLASSQIGRLRDEPGITLTVCVDRVAASGGYMMACMSSPGRLYAAPFAMLGSIGVLGQTVNVHDALESWGVKPLVFRGGKDKAPLGTIGQVTREGIAKVQGMVDKTHDAFKRHVVEARPVLQSQLRHVTTGDTWLGRDALQLGLVDRVVTSDEYLSEKMRDGSRVLKLVKHQKKGFLPLGQRRSGLGSPLLQLLGWRRIFASVEEEQQQHRGFWSDVKKIVSRMSDLLDDLPGGRDNAAAAGGAIAKAMSGTNGVTATGTAPEMCSVYDGNN